MQTTHNDAAPAIRQRLTRLLLGTALLTCVVTPVFITAAEDPHNAFIEIFPTGAKQDSLGIAIKDNIDIAGRVTSGGSLALANNVAPDDAHLIENLRQAGFHLFGKTNLSEWANFRSIKSVSGWSSLGGQTTHVLGAEYNPCGSSSGSAVAVAAGMVRVAVGTETNGSITCPASVSGIVGMKPTLGLVSRDGIIPIAASQDTAGPMGDSVAVVARALEAMAGYDAEDSRTADIPSDFDFNLVDATNTGSLAGKKFGLLDSGRENEQGQRFLNELTRMIEHLGGQVIAIDDSRRYPSDAAYFLLLYEFNLGLESYLRTASEPKKTLQALIDFNNQNAATVMPHFGQEIFLQSLAAAGKSRQYSQALTDIEKTRRATLRLFQANELDGLVGLTRGPAWKIDYVGGDDRAAGAVPDFGNGGFAAILGMPHITIPAFQIEGFPVGLSIIGRKWKDKDIIGYAAALERHIRLGAPPIR